MTDVATAAATRDAFAEALKVVLVLEGGKVDDPHDPGGRTNQGITQRVYTAWRQRRHLPALDVFKIADAEVEAIYRDQFWVPSGASQMSPGIDLVVFDGAVHSGQRQSVKWLQRALGFDNSAGRRVDGFIGSMTIAAVEADIDHDRLIEKAIDRRETFLLALKTFPRYGRGWLKRISVIEATAQAWASGSEGPAIEPIPDGDRNASVDDASRAPPKAPGDLGVGAGVGAGGLGELVRQAQGQLEAYAAMHWVQVLVVGCIVVGVLLAGGSLLYRWWATSRTHQLADALDPDPIGVAAPPAGSA